MAYFSRPSAHGHVADHHGRWESVEGAPVGASVYLSFFLIPGNASIAAIRAWRSRHLGGGRLRALPDGVSAEIGDRNGKGGAPSAESE